MVVDVGVGVVDVIVNENGVVVGVVSVDLKIMEFIVVCCHSC